MVTAPWVEYCLHLLVTSDHCCSDHSQVHVSYLHLGVILGSSETIGRNFESLISGKPDVCESQMCEIQMCVKSRCV